MLEYLTGFCPVFYFFVVALWRISLVLAGFAREVLVNCCVLCFYKLMLCL